MAIGAFEVNKMRPTRGGLSTNGTVRALTLPGRTMFPLSRRVNTPTATVIGGNSIIGMNAGVTRTNNFISTTVFSSMSNGIGGMSTMVSTDNCHGPTVFVSISNSR